MADISAGKNKIDMLSHDKLVKKLILFALPIFACGVVQQSFNAVDIAVVGNYVGDKALAAVGSNGPVIALLVNLFMGLSLGANVIIAHYIGERNNQGIERAVATSAALALASGIGMTMVGLLFAPKLLLMLDTPVEIIDKASEYLRFLTLGFPAMMIFNFGSAVLRSIGDTRRPFYCLVVSGCINVALNLFFVCVLKMGVEGVALSTTIANYISALLIVIILKRETGPIRLNFSNIRFFKREFLRIIQIGLPAGIQGMVFALSNVFIQSGINTFGPKIVSGSAAAITFEFYCYFVISAFNQAAVAFISQNYGAGQFDMCKSVFKKCMILSLVTCATMNVGIVLLAPAFSGIFTTDSEVIQYATQRICTVLLFQFIACSYEISGGAMRALGHSLTPMVITIAGTCILRILWKCSGLWHSFEQLLIIYPISWTLTGLLMLIAYKMVSRKIYGSPIDVKFRN